MRSDPLFGSKKYHQRGRGLLLPFAPSIGGRPLPSQCPIGVLAVSAIDAGWSASDRSWSWDLCWTTAPTEADETAVLAQLENLPPSELFPLLPGPRVACFSLFPAIYLIALLTIVGGLART